MDFTHLSITTVKRSKQQTSVARAAYQSGHRLVDGRTGDVHDYRYRRENGEISFSALVHPDGRIWANPSPSQLESLWSHIEQVERRWNSQVGRSVIVALPHVLSEEGQRQVCRRFSLRVAQRYRTMAQFDLHHPSRHAAADPRNIHGHLLIPTRSLDERGRFDNGAKIRVLSNRTLAREEVKALRGLWVDTVNEELAREGIVREDGSPLRLDPRSYRERGIERIPEVHLGVAATALERKGVPTVVGDQNRAIREDNAELARLDEELARLERERRLLLTPSLPDVVPGGVEDAPESGERTGPDDGAKDLAHRQRDVSIPTAVDLVSDITDYQALVEIEMSERGLLNRITAAEQDSQVTLDEPLRAALAAFSIEMRKVFQDVHAAERSWREYLTRHGDQKAVMVLQNRPELFGALRVRPVLLGLRQNDRTAREAAPRAAEAGARLARELDRLERGRVEAEGRKARLMAELMPAREWMLMRKRMDALRLRITEQWLALPASVTGTLQATHPDIARLVEKTRRGVEPDLGTGRDFGR